MTRMPDAGERNAAQKVTTGDELSEEDMKIKRVRQVATLGIVGVALTASPIIYELDGKQYVAIASATAILNFGLFEPVRAVPLPKIVIQK